MTYLLKFDGHFLIAEVEEIPGVQFGDPDCTLKHPYRISGNPGKNPTLTKFPNFAKTSELTVRSSDITFIIEPDDFIVSRYYEAKADTE